MKKQFWYFIFLLFYIGTLPVQGKDYTSRYLIGQYGIATKGSSSFLGKSASG